MIRTKTSLLFLISAVLFVLYYCALRGYGKNLVKMEEMEVVGVEQEFWLGVGEFKQFYCEGAVLTLEMVVCSLTKPEVSYVAVVGLCDSRKKLKARVLLVESGKDNKYFSSQFQASEEYFPSSYKICCLRIDPQPQQKNDKIIDKNYKILLVVKKI